MKNLIKLVVVFVLTSCSAAPVPKVVSAEVDETETYTVCEDTNGKTLECTFDEDCCEGFVCVPDRELGKYTKTCLEDK